MTKASQTPGDPAELNALVALVQRELRAGRLAEAAKAYGKILAIRPDSAEAHNDLGVILAKQGDLGQSVARFQQALVLKPDYAEAHNNLGNLLLNQGKLDEAAARFERVLALRPNLAEAHNNLGNVLVSQGKLDEAVARYEQAVALRPNYVEALKNLGVALSYQGKLDQALARFEQAVALWPDFPDARYHLAARLLLAGDYQRGWPAFEWRLRMPGRLPPTSLPRWQGEPLAGRRVLLIAEAGLGDTLQFVRYARALKERGARVVLASQAPLGRLLASHPDLDELFILGSAAQLPRADFYLPLLSAPGALHTTLSTIPRDVPYLWADPGLTEKWRAELAASGGFKIGIVWQCSGNSPLDRWRSIPLSQFAPLAGLPGVRLVSLQKGLGSDQVAGVDFPVLELSGRLDEANGAFMDTAAVIRGLDLVVTPDTAIAHLAGALGAPVWLALQFSPHWVWLQGRDDTPWYPTMRLFRQSAFGQWPDVFDRIAKAVQELVRERPSGSTGPPPADPE